MADKKKTSRKGYPVKGLERHGRKWRWRKMIAGRKISHTFEAASEAEAVAWVLAREGRPEVTEAGAWEFEVRRYVTTRTEAGELSQEYGKVRALVLLREGERMGLRGPGCVTRARLQGWYDERVSSGEIAVVSANHYLRHFVSLLGWLLAEGKVAENVALGVRTVPDPDNAREVYLTSGEVACLLARAREDHVTHNARFHRRPDWQDGAPWLELILLLGCECGLRRGEISAARGEWVDLKRGLLVVPAEDGASAVRTWRRKGKGRSRRGVVVPMVSGLREWFERYGVGEPFLVRPEKGWGRAKYRYDFAPKMNRFLKRHGFGHVTIHDFRRSFASNRVSAGTSMEKVANWMGIGLKTAWERYARFVPDDGEIEAGSAGEVATGESGNVGRSVRERLLELGELREGGLVSGEEFEFLRGEILGKI